MLGGMEIVLAVLVPVAVLLGWLLAGRPGAVAPLPADLGSVRAELSRLHESVARSHGELRAQLATANEQTAVLGATTGALRQALASPRARGVWGERMADDVLRLAGLVEGVSYVRQRATRSGTVPDLTILLPGERVLHVDVKFPVDNYLKHLEATSDEARDLARVAFLRDVRSRVREIGARGYVDAAAGTLDYAVVFLPNESVYAFVHEHDPSLLDEALSRKVVLCSPLTFYAVLAVARQAADAAALARSSGEVLEVLATFGREWDRFCESLDKVGRAVDAMERAYGELAGTRRRALERPLAHIDELRHGVRGEGREPAVRSVS
jgi:DNA recombination protein RmuC